MKATAIVSGSTGMAEFRDVELPDQVFDGVGQCEPRPPGPMGAWHTAKRGSATLLLVGGGIWQVAVKSGETRSFGVGSIVLVQDGDVAPENGHQSRSAGPELLVLFKVTISQTYPFET